MRGASIRLLLLGCLMIGCDTVEPPSPVDAGTDAQAPPVVDPPRIAVVHILDFHEFQGQLRAHQWSSRGGAARMAARIAETRREVGEDNVILVSGGDLTGASQLLSSAFHDEPSVAMANLIGLRLMVPGNTDLDRSRAEFDRLFGGGCHPLTGCVPDSTWEGANFELIAANIIDDRLDPPGPWLTPYLVEEVAGVRVGFVGAIAEGFRAAISSESAEELRATAPVEAISAQIPALQADGVDVIVAMQHSVGRQMGDDNECVAPDGPVFDIAHALPPEVDLVLVGSGGTPFVCDVNGRMVISSGSHGEAVAHVEIRFDLDRGVLLDVRARNLPIERELTPHEEVEGLLLSYEAIGPGERVVGTITRPFARDSGLWTPESQIGNLIADVYLALGPGEPELALMNSGGIRGPLLWERFGSERVDGQVRLTELAEVIPFGNHLVTLTISGVQLHEALLTQVGPSRQVFVSAGFRYALDTGGSTFPVIDPLSMTLHGVPIDPAGSYRVTVNNFMAGGGAGLAVLTAGTDRLDGVGDIEAFEAYFAEHSPLEPSPLDRVDVE